MGPVSGGFAGFTLAAIAVAAAGCAQGGHRGLRADIAAPPGATAGVCARNAIPAQSDVVLVVAIFKDGKTANFLCDRGYAPAAAGRPTARPPDFRPTGLTPGPIVALPVYQKWQDEKGDPCILLSSGGRKQYYCW